MLVRDRPYIRIAVLPSSVPFLLGASVWRKYSTDDGLDPDVTLVGIGVEVTVEVIAAATLLKREGIRVRIVNVVGKLLSKTS